METIRKRLQPQAWMIAAETLKIMEALLEDGGDARFVGGCVRNALANRPVADIDIATPLKPEEVIERLKRRKISYAPTGLKHGTVTAIVDGHPFEITTLRRDIETDGRHAKVAFTDDWEADASRRDFTMNTMYATPEGDLYDPFNGVEDLRLGRVRFVGNAEERIREDVLRILRFFRFYAHFGKGDPDAEGLKACADAAPEIRTLSAERIRHEILKLLEAEACPGVWKLMAEAGITEQFLPEAKNTAALERLVRLENKYHSGGFVLRRLAALLNEKNAGEAAENLKLSNEQTRQIAVMTNPPQEISVRMDEKTVHKTVYHLGNDMTRNLLLLAAAQAGTEGDLPQLYQAATSFRPPRLPVTGEDVIKTGVKSGPDVGRILDSVEEWWIENDFKPNRAACLEKLKEWKTRPSA